MDTDAFVREQIGAFPGQFKAAQGALSRSTAAGLSASDELAAVMRQQAATSPNTPALALAAAMFAPTRTGGFGESLSGGITAYTGALQQQRTDQLDRATKLAQLQMARAKLEQEGAMGQLGFVEKGMGFGATAAGAYGSLSDLGLVTQAPAGVPVTKAQAAGPAPIPGGGLGAVAGNPAAAPGAPTQLPIPGAPPAPAGGVPAAPAPAPAPQPPVPAGGAPAGLQPTPGSPGTNPPPPAGAINLRDIPAAARAMAVIDHARSNPQLYRGPNGIARYKEAEEQLRAIITAGQGVDAYGRVGYIIGGKDDPTYRGKVANSEAHGKRGAEVQYEPREIVDDSGNKVFTTTAEELARANRTGIGSRTADSPDVTKRREINATNEDTMRDQFKGRQVVRQRINELFDIGQTLQTGAWADVKGDIVARMRSLGIPFKDTDTANPAAVQQWIKNSTANVFDQVKALGGRILVSEIEGLAKANAQPNLEPAANLAILTQMRGLLDYEDKYYKDYFGWREKNRGNPYVDEFDRDWYSRDENKPQRYIDKIKKDVGAKGIPIPPPEKRVLDQVYVNPNGVPARWTKDGWVPVQQRTGDR